MDGQERRFSSLHMGCDLAWWICPTESQDPVRVLFHGLTDVGIAITSLTALGRLERCHALSTPTVHASQQLRSHSVGVFGLTYR